MTPCPLARTLAVLVSLATVMPASAGFYAAPPASGPPGVLSLARRARQIVRKQEPFARAVLLEAEGTASQPTTTAKGIDHWRFVFDNQGTPGSEFRSAFVEYRDRRFGPVTGNRSAFLEDRELRPLPRMPLGRAIRKLRAAGYTEAFDAVTLRYPLGPGFTEPLYIFGLVTDSPFIGVGTKTGTVGPIS